MIEQLLHTAVEKALQFLYLAEGQSIQFQKTRKDFDGDITLVVFPFLRASKKGPEQTANELGQYLQEKVAEVCCYNVVKGFLNLSIDKNYWLSQFITLYKAENYGIVKVSEDASTYLVEYSSPNTNKPLHLGHIRNNLLGYSVAEIIKASGKNVKKVQIINDRGIHICKSMVAWQLFGQDETPESTGLKGDHLVGKYYVEFDKHYRAEQADLIAQGVSEEEAAKQAPIFLKAKEILRQWEAKDPSVYALWEKMNNWVYDGFAVTYDRLGVDFDKNYYESNTYLLGKEVVQEGLDKGTFYQKEDGSVWIDLTADGLDEKLILRSDGTAVYMTQDIGTAIQRHDDFGFSNMAYAVGNEQDYHFKVLFLILDKLGYNWAKNCYHLSYGMVDLPSGKMKSREGTVVDADDLMQEMVDTAQSIAQELGKLDGMSGEEADALYEQIGLGALKYFMLKVDPKKRMMFDPEESIDFNGNTGPFIQYTHARIQSILRKYGKQAVCASDVEILDKEQEIIKLLLEFPATIQEAADQYSPALIANYTYDLVKEYNGYYQNTPILVGDNKEQIAFRVALSDKVAQVIKTGMGLLGVAVPNRM
ncbi:MAG: arginine--tRNA ligase [Flavobacteriales bacterium]|nr:arginine--tRNA ligase [Flavobacteriales bacterium]|tara:strand:+ start:1444 stop:3213 length:1770 start_codon:yes stop_codon:yes gene_type:complete